MCSTFYNSVLMNRIGWNNSHAVLTTDKLAAIRLSHTHALIHTTTFSISFQTFNSFSREWNLRGISTNFYYFLRNWAEIESENWDGSLQCPMQRTKVDKFMQINRDEFEALTENRSLLFSIDDFPEQFNWSDLKFIVLHIIHIHPIKLFYYKK